MFVLIPILLALWTLGWWLRPRLQAPLPPQDGPLPEDGTGADPTKVSVIVPARNEAKNLPRLIHSFRAQHKGAACKRESIHICLYGRMAFVDSHWHWQF